MRFLGSGKSRRTVVVSVASVVLSLSIGSTSAQDGEPDLIPDPGNKFVPPISPILRGEAATAGDSGSKGQSNINSRALTPAEIAELNRLPPAIENFAPDTITYNSTSEIPVSDSLQAEIEQRLAVDGKARVLVTLVADITGVVSRNERQEQDRIIELFFSVGSVEVLRRYDNLPIYYLEVDSAAYQNMLNSADVVSIELDKQSKLLMESTTPLIHSDDLNAHSTNGGSWDGGGGDWEVAVIDDGLRGTHAAFQGRIESEACFNVDGSCPNNQTSQIGAGAASGSGNCPGSHGSHVAGTAVGDFKSTSLLTQNGVAPKARLHAIDVFRFIQNGPSGPDCYANVSDQVLALNHVLSLVNSGKRIASVNLSLGGGNYSGVCDSIGGSRLTAAAALRNKGVLVVAAAGNSRYRNAMGAPACLSAFFSVGSTTDSDEVSYFSNVSSVTDLWAPGSSVTSAGFTSDSHLRTIQGTSMAAPHVAGAAAILRECYAAPGGPATTPQVDDQIAQVLKVSGTPVTDGRSSGIHTKGRLDLHNAIDIIRPHNMFDSAFQLPSTTSGSQMGMNTCANNESGEPHHNNNNETTGGLWYEYTSPTSGYYEIKTCDNVTSFDTVLSTYKGDSVSSLELLRSNDDVLPGTRCSVIVQPLTTGETINISVSGYGRPEGNGATGVFRLSWKRIADLPTCNGVEATITGTNNGETLVGTSGNDVIVALGGNDKVFAGGGADIVCLGDGNDVGHGQGGSDVIKGGDGNDFITGGNRSDRLYGEDGDDLINGGSYDDLIFAGKGSDVVNGDAGNDRIYGQQAVDIIYGGDGDDKIYGGRNNDVLWGGDGVDWLSGETGQDKLYSEAGNDRLNGGDHDDTLYGGSGDDFIRGGDGRDKIWGQKGNDDIRAQAGDDLITDGGNGTDRCQVAPGNDVAPVNCE